MSIEDATAQETAIPGLLVLTPKSITDDRGAVRELFRASTFPGAPPEWKQINLTRSVHGAVRGLHGETMTKLVGVVSGTAFGAYVDARPDSAAHGTVVTIELAIGTQVLVPAGVCNGFQATSPEGCEYLYAFDTEWAPDLPGVALNPLDPDLAIAWPVEPKLSAKDSSAPRFAELSRS